MRKLSALALGMSLFGLPAMATAAGSNVDLYYVAIADVEIDNDEFEEGDGFGASGAFGINDNWVVTAEYQSNDYEDPGEGEFNQMRAGLGYVFSDSPFYVRAEYADFEVEASGPLGLGFEADDSGWGAHVGAIGNASDTFSMNAEAGYLDAGDFGDGWEFLVGGAWNFSEQYALFVDYRYTALEGDDEFEYSIGDLRAGVRFGFGT